MKKTTSLILTLVMLISIPLSASAVEKPQLGSAVSGNVTYHYVLSSLFSQTLDSFEEGIADETVYYTDAWFADGMSANEYNHGLAIASIATGITSSTFDYSGVGHVENANARICALLSDLGFDEETIKAEGFDYCNTYNDDCAVAFGLKSIPGSDKYLLAIVPRGNGYGGSWASNVRMYDKDYIGYASGFRKSAEYALDLYDAYLEDIHSKYGIEPSDLRLWISGYSRGAALANNLGQMLTDRGDINPEDIFVYGTAVPNTVEKDAITKEYKNIFSICSELDLVSRIPFVEWDYTHFGTTLYLPCLSKNGDDYYTLLENMQTEFNKIMSHIGLEGVENDPIDYQEKVIDLLASYLCSAIKSPYDYKSGGWQKLLDDIMRAWKCYDNGSGDILSVVINSAVPAAEVIPDLIDYLSKLCLRTPRQNIAASMKVLSDLSIRKALAASKRDKAVISMLLEIVDNIRVCITSELITGGQTDSLKYYDILLRLIADTINNKVEGSLFMQHWSESYLAWLRSGDPEDIFTTEIHDIVPIKRPTLIGDVNSDGNVDIKDVRLLQKYVLAPRLVKIDKEAADIDGDGRICLCDAVRLELLLIVNL